MNEYASDQPANASSGQKQRTSSVPHAKRNNRNRKNNQQLDGAVSDGVVANHVISPRLRKTHNQRQSVVSGAQPSDFKTADNNSNMGRVVGQKQRPVSTGASLLPATPAKEQAYAGPTFQASPAAASLPMPKFFSKSVPNGAQHTSLQTRLEREKAAKKEESSPESDPAAPVPTPPREMQQSPLDFFFIADREEKARNSSNSMSPQAAARQPPATVPRNMFQQSGKSIFLRELDGSDEDMPSPRTVPPQGRPVINDRARSSPGLPTKAVESDSERQAYTKSLKDLLLNTAAQSSTPPRSDIQTLSGSQTRHGSLGSPSSTYSGTSTPPPSSELQDHYSLHYGNRNLSPLFKSARSETPSRPSSLRQEMSSDFPTSGYAPSGFPAHPNAHSSIDTDTAARSYLKEQIRTSGPAELPDLPWGGSQSGHTYNGQAGPVAIPVSPLRVQHGLPEHPNGSTTPRSETAQDVRGMENDLRRMLKLNVLG